jgi:uncharacterized LabA/DUF88 family protein
MKEHKKVALFIDAENISSRYAERIIADSSDYGNLIVKRIFADWSKVGNVSSWKESISKFSLLAEHQFNFVSGKDSSDIALIIDALIVLFEKEIDVFCLASSDCDFTRLVQELRERGKTVVGFGEKKTNASFSNAFTEFVYIDEALEEEKTKQTNKPNTTKQKAILETEQLNALIEIIETLIEEKGKALYAQIASDMKNKYPTFIPKNFGFRSTKSLMEALVKNGSLNNYKIKTEDDNTTICLLKK